QRDQRIQAPDRHAVHQGLQETVQIHGAGLYRQEAPRGSAGGSGFPMPMPQRADYRAELVRSGFSLGSTAATKTGFPSLIWTITTPFWALWSRSIVMVPVTPGKFLVCAIARARSLPSKLLARFIASNSTIIASYPSPPRASGVAPYAARYFSTNSFMFGWSGAEWFE